MKIFYPFPEQNENFWSILKIFLYDIYFTFIIIYLPLLYFYRNNEYTNIAIFQRERAGVKIKYICRVKNDFFST